MAVKQTAYKIAVVSGNWAVFDYDNALTIFFKIINCPYIGYTAVVSGEDFIDGRLYPKGEIVEKLLLLIKETGLVCTVDKKVDRYIFIKQKSAKTKLRI